MSRVKWRIIPIFQDYEVSDTGLVRKRHNKKQLRQTTSSNYKTVSLRLDGVIHNARVHRLVLYAFVGMRPRRIHAMHLNNVKWDNRLENLKWGTATENALHYYATTTRKSRYQQWQEALRNTI